MITLFGDDEARADFETFWALYPRKVGKGAARKAFDKAIYKIGGRDPVQTLCDAVVLFAAAVESGDIRFVPHAGTWLNQERWTDDIEHVRRGYAQPEARPDPGARRRDERTGRMLQGFVRAAEQRRQD